MVLRSRYLLSLLLLSIITLLVGIVKQCKAGASGGGGELGSRTSSPWPYRNDNRPFARLRLTKKQVREGSTTTSSSKTATSSSSWLSTTRKIRYPFSFVSNGKIDDNETNNDVKSNNNHQSSYKDLCLVNDLRAGGINDAFDNVSRAFTITEQSLKLIIETITTVCMIVLPPIAFTMSNMIKLYQALPHDAILASAGLVYCFAGGYFPTLFAAVSAAQHSGMNIMVAAVGDLAEEATKAIEAAINDDIIFSNDDNDNNENLNKLWSSAARTKTYNDLTSRERFGRKTRIVLTTIDPIKINTAISSLYTTWLGISSVLEKQFAKTISLSITIADYLYPAASFLLQPPLNLLIPNDFHKWVPLLLQWGCKAIAMSFAWKIQRVLSAASSAIVGGLMFSRAFIRLIFRKKPKATWRSRKNKRTPQDSPMFDECFDESKTPFDEIIGLAVAALGLYTQIGHGFSFKIPFPINLITWPFSLAENWIQWQITKDNKGKA